MDGRLTGAVCGCLALAGSVFATETSHVKAIELSNKREPLTVDGDFGDWGTKVQWRTDFLNPSRGEPDNVRCRFALKRDWGNLFIAFRADGAYRKSDAPVAHDGDLWKENSVLEVFFARPNSSAGYVQFSLAANGGRQDGKDGDGYVNPDWEAAVKTDADGWQAEIRIPFKEIEVDAKHPDDFRMNLSMGFPIVNRGDPDKRINWSLADGKGVKNVPDMGYVVPGSFQKGSQRLREAFERDYGVAASAAEVSAGDERGYLAFRTAIAAECQAQDVARVRRLTEKLAATPDLPTLLVQDWTSDRLFGETSAAQADLLESALDAKDTPVRLAFASAVNETTHRSFVLSAPKATADVTFGFADLKGTGGVLPADRLSVARFAFLHPPADIQTKGSAALALPYPELVEWVEDPQAFKAGESSLFRLYVDTRGVRPDTYAGEMTVRVEGETVRRLPVTVSVVDLELPLPETHPFDVYLFTTIPWGGESAERWARFFRDHYVTDVSFEHPQLCLDGVPVAKKEIEKAQEKTRKPAKTKQEKALSFVDSILANENVPLPGTPGFDLKKFEMDERLRACAKYGLRPVMSNRSGYLWAPLFPLMMSELATCGITPDRFLYKLGDEDRSLVYLPAAKRLREIVPGLHTTMIPSGPNYFDLKPAAEGFTDFTFSAASYRGGAEGYKDIAYLRSKGVKVSRYLNGASWAGRNQPLRARNEPWEALVVDGLDGYACWTACIRRDSKYQTGYAGYNPKYRIAELPPENQIASFLVYIRKVGETYRPVSCIRLENIRDGLVDALYYKLARERAEQTGDTAVLAQLKKIARRPKPTIVDYEAARAEMRAILVSGRQN